MGDECRTCRYNPKERLGETACPFNALYWHFHLRHQTTLGSNPRLGFVYKQLENMSETQQQQLEQQAHQLLSNMNEL